MSDKLSTVRAAALIDSEQEAFSPIAAQLTSVLLTVAQSATSTLHQVLMLTFSLIIAAHVR